MLYRSYNMFDYCDQSEITRLHHTFCLLSKGNLVYYPTNIAFLLCNVKSVVV